MLIHCTCLFWSQTNLKRNQWERERKIRKVHRSRLLLGAIFQFSYLVNIVTVVQPAGTKSDHANLGSKKDNFNLKFQELQVANQALTQPELTKQAQDLPWRPPFARRLLIGQTECLSVCLFLIFLKTQRKTKTTVSFLSLTKLTEERRS